MITNSTRPDGQPENFLATKRKAHSSLTRSASPAPMREKRDNDSPQGAVQIAKTLLSVVLNTLAAGFLFCAIFYADTWASYLVELVK